MEIHVLLSISLLGVAATLLGARLALPRMS